MEQAGKVAKEKVEPEQKDAGMRFAGVGIGPQPRAVGSLAHLCQIRRGVVADEEEAGEMMAGRSPGVGEQVGEEREHRYRGGEPEGKAGPRPPPGGQLWGRPG